MFREKSRELLLQGPPLCQLNEALPVVRRGGACVRALPTIPTALAEDGRACSFVACVL